jgi:LmbE family N-acetylglucosaminyl deacetylase
MADARPLAELPEDWSSALAVVAHPDDMEYGASCAVARWTAQGKTVRYLLATRGEAGMDGLPPEQAGPLRAQEQWAACAAVGVRDLEFLDHPDGVIADAMRLRREVAAAIRRHRPDVVITGTHREIFGPGLFNMADHRVVGLAVLDAVRDAANRWVFTDLTDADGGPLEPWSGVRFTAINGSSEASHAVDITDSIDAGIASLEAHRAYLDGLGGHAPDPGEMLRMFAGFGASRFGGRLCATFEVIGLPIRFGESGPEPAQNEPAQNEPVQNVTGSDSRP